VIGDAPGPLRQSVEVIERQAAQMSRLVDDMLDLARIGQGRFELRRSRLALARIVEQAVLGVEPVMKANRHRITVSLPDPALELDADADRLLQIIGNLLNNAAKYTPAGGEIVLAAAQEGRNAVIRVRDNGIGIPPQMLSRVFDLFAQVEGAKEYAQGGLGIGLTLVRRLVEQHGGSISCHSDGAGTGSEFVVHLPLAAAAHDSSFSDAVGGETAIRIVRHEP
jgi:signal transduction histidine kinase